MLRRAGTKLQHYKGGRYTVITAAMHSETGDMMLVYQSDKDQKVWVRPLSMFFENVDYKGATVPRFRVVD